MLNTYSYPTTSSNSPQAQYLWKRLLNTLKSITEFHDNDKEEAAISVLDLSSSSPIEDTNTVLSTAPHATKLHRKRRRTTIQSAKLSFCKDQKYWQQKNVLMVPPFSPTYCRPNHFPYSNFYIKLPDGRWMIRFRDGNRSILGTDVIHGYLI